MTTQQAPSLFEQFINRVNQGPPAPSQSAAPTMDQWPSYLPQQPNSAGLASNHYAAQQQAISSMDDAARQRAAIEAWNGTIPQASKEGAAAGKAVADLAAGTTGGASTGTGVTPLIDPLAVQLFFTQAIAPMLQGLQGKLGAQNKQFTDMAQANLEHWNLPESYRAIFGQSIPRQAAAQNDVIAALSGAAAAGPALDQLMSLVGQARSASYQDMQAQQAGMALGGLSGGTNLQATLDALAGVKPKI